MSESVRADDTKHRGGEMSVSGMLWRDDDAKHSLNESVWVGALAYFTKYNHWPNTVYMHPATSETGEVDGNIIVVSDARVQMGHYVFNEVEYG